MLNRIYFFLLLFLGTNVLVAQNSNSLRIGFYNVENLFDLEDAPDYNDEDFLPTGRQEWTQERYDEKLSQLAKVVDGMAYPSLLGLCEVENETVLKDFSEKTSLEPFDYDYVHFDSPDFRGIDVGLLYKSKEFKVMDSEIIRINFPKEIIEDYTTRDILYVKGNFKKKDVIHVFINHWPSRRGGLRESEPKRLYVAEQLRNKLNEIQKEDPQANILIMGDFNDEPANNSITNVLMKDDETLFNCFKELDDQEKGSYNYRGNWNMLDQIIVSNSFVNGDMKWKFQNAEVFSRDWMMYTDKKYGPRPNRTYGGPRYFGGFSDHLPVYIELVKN